MESPKNIIYQLLINKTYGGFRLSKQVYNQLPHLESRNQSGLEFRMDPQLIKLFKSNRSMFDRDLRVAQIITSSSQSDYPMLLPEWFQFEITEYDGKEGVRIDPIDPRMKLVSQIVTSPEKSDPQKVEAISIVCKLVVPIFKVEYVDYA